MMALSWFVVLLVGGVLGLLLTAALVALIVVLARRGQPAARVDEPTRVGQVERISREIEKINEMQTAGRISADEAADLKLALEGERREWTAGCAQVAKKRLTKSRNAVIAGVCGGLAEWIGCDATLVRVVYALLTLFMAAFPGILLYIILWIVMPPPAVGSEPHAAADPDTRSSGGKASKGWLILLLCLLAVPLVLALLLLTFLFASTA